LSKILTPILTSAVAFGNLTSTHRPKTCGQAKIPGGDDTQTPSFLPARFCPLRGRADISIKNYFII
jgi:hypothetical protein